MKAKEVVLGAVLFASFILSLIFDDIISKNISSLQNSFLNQFMVIISYLGLLSVLIIIVACVFLIHNKKSIFLVISSFAITEIIVILLKVIVHRARPFEALGLNTLSFLIDKTYTTWNLSFPSSHAALVFAALPFFKGKIKYYWLAFALLVSFSRVFFSLHYLSDVIAGAVIGYAASTLVVKIFKQKELIK